MKRPRIGRYKGSMSNRKLLSYLLSRDEHRCGIHIGGCRKKIPNRADGSIDHIFTRSFFKDREVSIKPKDYNEPRNCQPMHKDCNKTRGGQIDGFPLFTCLCHWLQIYKTSRGHVLRLFYRTNKGTFSCTVVTEENRFVFENPSAGKFASELGEINISGAWSMAQLKPGKKGIVGPGHLGHGLPRIDPEEVDLFNRLERQRIRGNSSETINKFNSRMIRMQVHYTSAS